MLNISDTTKNIIAIINSAPGIADGSLQLNWLFIVAIIISVQPIIFIIIDTNSNILISYAPGFIIVVSIEMNVDIGNEDRGGGNKEVG